MDSITETKLKVIAKFLEKKANIGYFKIWDTWAWELLRELEEIESYQLEQELQQEYFTECAKAFNV